MYVVFYSFFSNKVLKHGFQIFGTCKYNKVKLHIFFFLVCQIFTKIEQGLTLEYYFEKNVVLFEIYY